MNDDLAPESWREAASATDSESVEDGGAGTVKPSIVRFYLAAAVLAGAFRSLTVLMVGQMPVSELVLMVVFAHAVLWFILHRRTPVAPPSMWGLKVLCACQVLAFCSYIVSDIWWQSAPTDMLRGWLRMVFVLLDIFSLSLIFGLGNRALVAFQIGACLSALQALVVVPLFGEYWKFGFGYPLTLLVLLTVPRLLGFWGNLLACVGLGALHTVLDFRSLGAICLVVGALNGFLILPQLTRKRLLVVAGIVVLFGMPWIARWMFADTEGRANRSNVERAAMLQAAWNGFLHSPVLGNGSWFSRSNVMSDFLFIRSQKAADAGGGLGFDDNDYEGIAIHSQILTALAEGGVVGGAFFLTYAGFLLWAFWFCLTEARWTYLTPTILFLLLTSFWDVWMSAFTGPIRVNIALTVALILFLLKERRELFAMRVSAVTGDVPAALTARI